MDRNGKKPKAARAVSNPQRSDMKMQTRDALGRTADDARAQTARAHAGRDAGGAGTKDARGDRGG